MPQVCRTCLEETPDINCIRLNNTSFKIKEELRVCLPEVDVELVPDAVMCIYCVNDLHSCFDFKQKCLLTEKQIRNQLHSQAAIDLAELKNASELEVLNGTGESMDVQACNETEVYEIPDNDNDVQTQTDINGHPNEIMNSVNNENDDEEDEDEDGVDSSTFVLGLCESAPRKHPPVTQDIVNKSHTSSVNLISDQTVANKIRKNTANDAEITISPIKTSTRPRRSSSSSFSCLVCKTTISEVYEYINHTNKHHTDVNPYYKCSKCLFTSTAVTTFLKHCETKHNYTDTRALNAETVKKVFRCPDCNYTCSEEAVFNKHINSHILQCAKCYHVATDRSTYQKHISTHSLSLETDDVVVIDDDEDLICNHCNYITKSTEQFEKHCSDNHEVKFPYVCKECGYTAGTKSSLIKHAKFHSGNRMYHCTYCTYNCDLLYNLNKHLGTRHGQT